ncbi:MAG: YgiQ family radical SAM protein [Clostridiales bacterium]|nr:YgiQ family radical SAM protein [Clostridiales bacterium]
MEKEFLPVSREDMKKRGWDQCDFVYVIGDAYVDHPSFGHAIISRILERYGYRVGIISQPDWKDEESIAVLGEPRLGFLVMGGNMDSMVNHYSVAKKRRKRDAYTPGGEMGKRPDYAAVVYANLIRRRFRNTPIILGGIEASLRRLAHYDYWSNKVKRSILLDSSADIVIYGMGEKAIIEVAEALDSGLAAKDICYVKGTVWKTKRPEDVYDAITLPTYDEVKENKRTYAESFYTQYKNTDPFNAKTLIEPYPNGIFVVQNPPQPPLTTDEMDSVYDLPYTRTYHPMYEKAGGIDAIAEVKFSLISNRGCFGSCNFCALTFHQGRIIQSRSHKSLIKEAELITKEPDFKGYIHDVGGPTANFRFPACKKQMEHGACQNRLCLFPKKCPNLEADHSDYLELLRKLRAIPGVKKVFIRSGIRFDYLIYDKDDSFMRELVQHHISGQLKVAPEHVCGPVLSMMGKPENSVYKRFIEKYEALNREYGKNQFVVPYLMSSHPGSTLKEAVGLAEYLRDIGYMPEQVQDFYPTPSTISTCMYYTGLDPRTMKPVYVPTDPHEKAMQRALIQYKNPKNRELVREALIKAGREDLIGNGKNCLIRDEFEAPRYYKKDAPQKSFANGKAGKNLKPQKGNKPTPKGGNNKKAAPQKSAGTKKQKTFKK